MDGPALAAAYALFKTSPLWKNAPGAPCQGFADANPGEAAKIDAYVASLAAGHPATVPTLATRMGGGLVKMLAAAVATPTPPPALHVEVTGDAVVGGRLTAKIS